MKWNRSIILLLLFFFVQGIHVQAEEAEIVSTNKSWTITFNTPLSPDSIHSEAIYVTNNETEKKVPNIHVSLSKNRRVVTLEPTLPLQPKTAFTIHITTSVRSAAGQPLRSRVTYPFRTNKASKYNEQAMDYFHEIAFGSEWEETDYPIRKWETNPRIKVFGSPSKSDMDALNATIADINSIQSSIDLKLVEENPTIEVYFVPLEDFDQYVKNPKKGNWGLFYYWWKAGYTINRAKILIATDKPGEQGRAHLIREELTQSLGLTRDSFSYPKSIFFETYTTHTEYTPLDKKLIQMLYEEEIRPGMSREEALYILQNIQS